MAKADSSPDNPLAGIVPGPPVPPVPEPPAVLVAYSYEQLRAYRLQGQPYIVRANYDEARECSKTAYSNATRTNTSTGWSGYRQICESCRQRWGLRLSRLEGELVTVLVDEQHPQSIAGVLLLELAQLAIRFLPAVERLTKAVFPYSAH